MSDKKKLFLLDAYAIIYRSYFAFQKNPRINSKGFNTGAIMGFMNTLLEVMNKQSPTHIGVAFDLKEPTFRHVEFPEYKAQREAQPEEISLCVPIIRDILEAMNIPVLEQAGFEADDVVGTLAKKAEKEGFEVYMVTLDKDYCQLVSENIFLYKLSSFGRGTEIYDIQKVLDKFKVKRVDQVVDVLGLWGDASDNIPGIPGIGEKTAQKLLALYDSVEGIIEHSHELKGKQKENVENFAEQGILSKHLAKIVTDMDFPFDEHALEITEPDEATLEEILDELEFRTLKNRIFGKKEEAEKPKSKKLDLAQFSLFDTPANNTNNEAEENESQTMKTLKSVNHKYELVDTDEKRADLIKLLSSQKEICFDTETDRLDAISAKLVGMSFSVKKGEAYYVPIPQDKEKAQPILEEFKAVFENKNIAKIGQNIKYDMHVLNNYGVRLEGDFLDTMLMHYLLNPEMRHNMDLLAESYLNYTPVSIESLIGKKGKNQGTMADLEPAAITDYACEDADITLQLKEIFTPQIKEANAEKLYKEVEAPLVTVLTDIERNGIKIDTDILAEMSKELEEECAKAENKIYELAGTQFNIASPKQLGEVLFDNLKLDPKAKKTKTGQYKTGEEILSKLADEHEIIDLILSFREYRKLKSTYVDALPKLISETDGRIHTSFRQAVAATGRLSSDNPNLQNIPIRTEKGRAIRKAFVSSDENHVLFAADYSQVELRIMAAFAKDEAMIEAFKNGRDIHATTASKVFDVPLEEVTPDQRRKAKEVNFGLIYGTSAFGLSQNLKISRSEAAEIIDSYWEEFPAVKQFMDASVNEARDNEYVETILGRRRYLRDINSRNKTIRDHAERNAVNAPIQGSAADMIKVAMINIHAWMKAENLKSKMILTVHDELVFDAHVDEVELLKVKVPELMSNAIPLEVPLEVSIGTGKNWLEAH